MREPRKCIVKNCPNSLNTESSPKIRFYRFPTDKFLVKIWKARSGLKDKRLLRTARICSSHFMEKDFDKSIVPGKKILKENAVPSLKLRDLPPLPMKPADSMDDVEMLEGVTEKINSDQTEKEINEIHDEKETKENSQQLPQDEVIESNEKRIMAKAIYEGLSNSDLKGDMTVENIEKIVEFLFQKYRDRLVRKQLCGNKKANPEIKESGIQIDENKKHSKDRQNQTNQNEDDENSILKRRLSLDETSSKKPKIAKKEETSNNTQVFSTNVHKKSSPPNYSNAESFVTQEKYDALKKKYEQLLLDKRNSEMFNSQIIESLKRTMEKNEREYQAMKKSKEKLFYEYQQVEEALQKMLTPNQIKLLMEGDDNLSWTNQEMLMAFAIRFQSRKCYQFLRQKLNYPLPGMVMVQKWLSTITLERCKRLIKTIENSTQNVNALEEDNFDRFVHQANNIPDPKRTFKSNEKVIVINSISPQNYSSDGFRNILDGVKERKENKEYLRIVQEVIGDEPQELNGEQYGEVQSEKSDNFIKEIIGQPCDGKNAIALPNYQVNDQYSDQTSSEQFTTNGEEQPLTTE